MNKPNPELLKTVRDGLARYNEARKTTFNDMHKAEKIADEINRALWSALLPDTPKYLVVPVKWDELLEADYERCELRWKEKGARTAVKNHTYSFPPCPKFESNFVGAVGDKVNMTLRLARVSGFESCFGYTSVYTFEDDRHNKHPRLALYSGHPRNKRSGK